ncbi:MAG: hypothetical protein MUP66_01770 [Candidatus Nanohaloarchaeota archaeon QJJ-5]|nr:hypothetical protein [Candidatus Nanohaloarchaeota archaeon QJJ-5]
MTRTRCRICGDFVEHEEHEDMELCHDCLHHGFRKLQQTIANMDDMTIDRPEDEE